jgi:hypothetical protein
MMIIPDVTGIWISGSSFLFLFWTHLYPWSAHSRGNGWTCAQKFRDCRSFPAPRKRFRQR